jgi:hypothetical protein
MDTIVRLFVNILTNHAPTQHGKPELTGAHISASEKQANHKYACYSYPSTVGVG